MFARKWSRRTIWIGVAVLLVIVVASGALMRARGTASVAQVPFSDLLRHLERGGVAELVVAGDTLDFKLSTGQAFRTVAPLNYVTLNPSFVTDLAKRNVRIDVRSAPEQTAYGFSALLLGVGFLGVLGLTLYRVTTGRIPALESKTREADKESSTVTFDDVAGVDEAKEEVKEIVDFLREPDRFSAIGGRIPKGVLLVGPPGTG